jgi:hypothetical protein
MMGLALCIILGLASPQEDSSKEVKGCQAACEKVTKQTARHWPRKRRSDKVEKDAYERMKKKVHESCMRDCNARGAAFVRCVKRARKIQQLSRCYQIQRTK